MALDGNQEYTVFKLLASIILDTFHGVWVRVSYILDIIWLVWFHFNWYPNTHSFKNNGQFEEKLVQVGPQGYRTNGEVHYMLTKNANNVIIGI